MSIVSARNSLMSQMQFAIKIAHDENIQNSHFKF